MTDKSTLIQTFENLFETYYADLCAYAYKYLKDTGTVEDIVSETFYQMWKCGDKLENIKSIKSYLYKSVYNNTFYYLRSKSNQVLEGAQELSESFQEDTDTRDAFHHMVLEELAEQLETAIEKLPTQQQKVFRLKRFEQKKNMEIAEELNISVKTVEMHMSKALTSLRKDLQSVLPSFIIVILLSM